MCLGRFFGGKNRTVSEEERAATKTLLQREKSRQGRFRGGKSRAESEGEISSVPRTRTRVKLRRYREGMNISKSSSRESAPVFR